MDSSSDDGGDDTDTVSSTEDSDDDSVGSHRSFTAPTISYSSLFTHGEAFSSLEEILPPLRESQDEAVNTVQGKTGYTFLLHFFR